MIRHLIFDLDGTLVDSCGVCVQILSEMLRDRGSEQVIDPNAARPWMSFGGTVMVAALLGADCGDPHDEIVEFRRRYKQHVTPPDALFDGVALGLRRMQRAGFELSICSNKPQELCESVLEHTGIAGFFSTVVGLKSSREPKPAPDLLDHVMAKTGATSDDSVFIGDSSLDHFVARAAGMPFVFMTYGYAEKDWHPGDSDCFDCFATMSRAVTDRIAPARAA